MPAHRRSAAVPNRLAVVGRPFAGPVAARSLAARSLAARGPAARRLAARNPAASRSATSCTAVRSLSSLRACSTTVAAAARLAAARLAVARLAAARLAVARLAVARLAAARLAAGRTTKRFPAESPPLRRRRRLLRTNRTWCLRPRPSQAAAIGAGPVRSVRKRLLPWAANRLVGSPILFLARQHNGSPGTVLTTSDGRSSRPGGSCAAALGILRGCLAGITHLHQLAVGIPMHPFVD